MARRYTYTTNIEFSAGDDCGPDYDLTVSYTVIPGQPERGPSYACGGTPAEPPLIEDMRLEAVNGKPRPWGMYDGWIANEDEAFEADVIDRLENSDRHYEAMLEEAAEADAADRDAWDDARSEERRAGE